MKKLLVTLAVVMANCASTTHAQNKEPSVKERSTIDTNAIPDWQSNYQQELARDYIRRRAQEKTAARQARIEGMKWLGHSPARPVISTTPFMSSAPAWVSAAPVGYWGPAFWPTRGHVHSPGWFP